MIGIVAGFTSERWPASAWNTWPDYVGIRIMGWADGRTALDYTVNAAVGVPLSTGPTALAEPVNHFLPAWDLLAATNGALAMVTALRHRDRTGEGREIRLPLADVALATMGNLGQIGEALVGGGDRPRTGNALFGAFGRDFATRDGRRVMLVAITPKEWTTLLQALCLADDIAALEREIGISLETDEGQRYLYRDRLFPLFERAVGGLTLVEAKTRLDATSACWDVYRSLSEALAHDPRIFNNPILADIEHPSGLHYPATGTAATFHGTERQQPRRALRLGEHNTEVLEGILGLSTIDIGKLSASGIIDSPQLSQGRR